MDGVAPAIGRTVDPSSARTWPSAAILVGRAREQDLLREELSAALHGRGALVLLTGEAGIGKTALANHLVDEAEAQGAAVAVGRCYEAGALPAFAPWRELFANLPDHAAAGQRLPPPFGTGSTSQTPYQLMAAITNILHGLANAQPLVLLLEDVHWADRDTLELLEIATRSLARVPMLVVATYRPDAAQRSQPLFDVLPLLTRDRPVKNLAVSSLGVGDAAQLIAASHGPCSPVLAEYLHARSDGHPLFLVELARDLMERRLLPTDEEGWLQPPTHPVEVPSLLHHLIAHRIARLGAEEETLLAVAAVAGEEWDLSVVEAVLGWEEEALLRALEGALRADVIATAGTGERYRFRHGLIREVLYGEQLARRRKHLHQRIGAVLEETKGASD